MTIDVVYITGTGHSGSTLLDIIIGNSPGFFSAGEAAAITKQTIREEFCSCGSRIGECVFWKQVVETWEQRSKLSLDEMRRLRMKNERPVYFFHNLVNMVFPSQSFRDYADATKLLFDCIREVSGKEIIVDSSKSPMRMAVLRRIAGLQVVHICRNARGVLNSSKKVKQKDLAGGVERDVQPRPTIQTLLRWIRVNLLVEIFSAGLGKRKIRYDDYIADPRILESIHPAIRVASTGLHAEHMLAGNRMRLQKNISIDRQVGTHDSRLTKRQLYCAAIVDRMFFFWS